MEEKTASTIEKKLRFRQPAKVLFRQDGENLDILKNDYSGDMEHCKAEKTPSLFSFLKVEVTRDYLLENDEERFSTGREKFYSFMKIPKEVEKFMHYGVMFCLDSFLFIYTFLPIRVILALWALFTRPFSKCFGMGDPKNRRILTPAEICDLLRAVILVFCSTILWFVDTNMMYHMIKSQSVIKLYLFYNMLEIGDKLLISFGQDTIDALLWTATEPKGRKREHLGVLPHLVLAVVYVSMHSFLILFQATTLNVAMNSNNKALLTIMMSNNFVELKGSVFKKFDKNNLFQVSCSDVRERFLLISLLFTVIIQTLKEYNWKIDVFYELLFDSIAVLLSECLIDWIKHAFITRFNEIQVDVYKDYRTSLAYDLTSKLQKHSFSGHSDLVARRMGFIPIPLCVVITRVLMSSVSVYNFPALVIVFVGYLCLWSIKILNSILIFGKACGIIAQHKMEKTAQNSPVNKSESKDKFRTIATSPLHPVSDQPRIGLLKNGFAPLDIQVDPPFDIKQPPSDFTASAIFANSTVDLKDASLNEELLKVNGEDIRIENVPDLTRSVPDIQELVLKEGEMKKSESEPSLVTLDG